MGPSEGGGNLSANLWISRPFGECTTARVSVCCSNTIEPRDRLHRVDATASQFHHDEKGISWNLNVEAANLGFLFSALAVGGFFFFFFFFTF